MAVLASWQSCWAQKASNWRVYKIADGLPEPGCASVTISPHGKVLARHLNLAFVTELDGYDVRVLPAPEKGRSRVYASAGGQRWTVTVEGLQEFKTDAWVPHPLKEVASATKAAGTRAVDPIPLLPVKQGRVLLLLPDRLLEFSTEKPDQPLLTTLRQVSDGGLERFTGMAAAKDGGLWIVGARGVAKAPGPLRTLRPETAWREFLVPTELNCQNLRCLHERDQGGEISLTLLAEAAPGRQRLVLGFDGQRWTAGAPRPERLQEAWRGRGRSWWGMTPNALLEWDEGSTESRENEEIFARQYFDMAEERGGNFWLATSDGLFRFSPLSWTTPSPVRRIASEVECLASDPQGRFLFVAGSSLYALEGERLHEYNLPAIPGRKLQPRGLFPLKTGDLALAFDEAGARRGDTIFIFRPDAGAFRPLVPETAGVLKVLGKIKDGNVCLQIVQPGAEGAGGSLQLYDGKKFSNLPDAPPAALGSNFITAFVAQNGDWWLSSELGLGYSHQGQWRVFTAADKAAPDSAVDFAEMPDGKIWCASRDQVWEYDGLNWSFVRGGFERINALLRTRDGNMWVASNGGLYHYAPGDRSSQGAWVDNGPDEGLPDSTVRELYEDSRGLWAATARGLSLFNPDADRDPPRTIIDPITEQDKSVAEGGAVTLNFVARDKWKYTPRERLLYSYRRDELDWSPFQELTRISYADLPAGQHYFQVRAMDRNCNIELKPAQLDFLVTVPWYRETRLVLISLAGLGGAFFFAIVAFNRHWQLVRSYAEVERKVAERTQELELANRELLHSQKMNALGTLAAGIAHDFNNILSIIKGSAQIIEDNLQNPAKIQVRTDRINTAVEQGAGIVKAMLGFTRDSDQSASPCDLNQTVADTLKLMGDRFLREVQVRFQPTPELPPIMASKDFVQQILLNFIFNAAESMTHDRQIVLRTGLVEKLPVELILQPAAGDRHATVSVQDFGCGIAPENLQRIFEPFFTTKSLSTRRGTGLGLSMAYELARKMGAGLAVESVLDQGSTFTLLLPAAPAAAELQSTYEQPHPSHH